MNKLLKANMSRLFKSKVFWTAFVFMFALGVFVVYSQYIDMVKYNCPSPLDAAYMAYMPFIGYVLAVFVSIFIGTDYSDGTIRNKMIVGHKRISIYLANLTVSFAASLLLTAAFLVPYTVLGVVILEPMVAPVTAIIQLIFLGIFTTAAFVAIFTMITMVTAKKSTSIVICFILFCVLLIITMTINSRLSEPEFVSDFELTANGVQQSDPLPNPLFLKPEARRVYQFFMDFLPTGQAVSICDFSVVNPVRMAVSAAALTGCISILGIAVFKKRNLK